MGQAELFDEVIALATEYNCKLPFGTWGRSFAASELLQRLKQLAWLYNQTFELARLIDEGEGPRRTAIQQEMVRRQQLGLSAAWSSSDGSSFQPPPEHPEYQSRILQVQTLAEAFYYIAGRLRAMCRRDEPGLPGLRQFQAKGVRDVRNHLIEHPEGAASRILGGGFGIDGSKGAIIKPMRIEGYEHFIDQGLVANASEFVHELTGLLRSAVREILAGTGGAGKPQS